MSMTISVQPCAGIGGTDFFQPLYKKPSPLVFKCLSNDPDIVAARITFTINVTNTISFDRDPDYGTTNEFTFDIGAQLKDYVSYKLHTTAISIYNHVVPALPFVAVSSIGIKEITDDGTGRVVESGTAFANAFYAYNIAKQFYESADLAEYVHQSAPDTGIKFLTNAPLSKMVGRNDYETLGVINNFTYAVGDSLSFLFTQYSDTGATLATSLITKTGVDIPGLNFDFGVAPQNLASFGISLNSNTDHYKVELIITDASSGLTSLSEARTFYIKDECDSVRVHFLNRMGRFDSGTLPARYVETLKVSSGQYEKYRGEDATVSDRGFEELNIEAQETFQAGSDIMSRDDLRWLQEMKTSPQVYIQEDEDFIPIIITNKADWKTDSDNPEDFVIKFAYASLIEVQQN